MVAVIFMVLSKGRAQRNIARGALDFQKKRNPENIVGSRRTFGKSRAEYVMEKNQVRRFAAEFIHFKTARDGQNIGYHILCLTFFISSRPASTYRDDYLFPKCCDVPPRSQHLLESRRRAIPYLFFHTMFLLGRTGFR